MPLRNYFYFVIQPLEAASHLGCYSIFSTVSPMYLYLLLERTECCLQLKIVFLPLRFHLRMGFLMLIYHSNLWSSAWMSIIYQTIYSCGTREEDFAPLRQIFSSDSCIGGHMPFNISISMAACLHYMMGLHSGVNTYGLVMDGVQTCTQLNAWPQNQRAAFTAQVFVKLHACTIASEQEVNKLNA